VHSMSEITLPLLVAVLVPGCALALLMWLAHLEDTLDQAVQQRSAGTGDAEASTEQSAAPGPGPAGQTVAP